MNATLQFQLRLTVSSGFAEALRAGAAGAASGAAGDATADATAFASYATLHRVLHQYHATLKCQYDAFADYMNEAQRLGTEHYPLYQWTRETIENPEKKAKYLQSFTVYVKGGEVYDRGVADALEAELLTLVDGLGITRVSRFDTNPANNPQPPAR